MENIRVDTAMAIVTMAVQRLHIVCWNMQTLVEVEDSTAMSVARPSSRGATVDFKATLMVQELKDLG